MAIVKIAMRHSQGVTMQDVALTTSGKVAIKIRFADLKQMAKSSLSPQRGQ